MAASFGKNCMEKRQIGEDGRPAAKWQACKDLVPGFNKQTDDRDGMDTCLGSKVG